MKKFLLAASSLLAALAPAASAQNYFIVEKSATYAQTSAAAPVLLSSAIPPLYATHSTNGTGIPFAFLLETPAAGSVSMSGTTTLTSTSQGGSSSNFSAEVSYGTQAAMDTAYPNGTYTASATGFSTQSISLTGNLYPSEIPQLMGGTFQNGMYFISNPAIANTLTFNNFSEYATASAGAHEQIEIQSLTSLDSVDLNNQIVSRNIPGLSASAAAFTSYVIPAGSLTAGGVYGVSLAFDVLSSLNTTSVTNGIAAGIYENDMVALVAVQTSPATPGPLIASQPTNVTGTGGGSVTIPVSITFNGSSTPPNLNNGGTNFLWFQNGNQINTGNSNKYQISFGGQDTNGTGSLTISNLASSDAGTYVLEVYNCGGIVYTNAVTVTVNPGSTSAPAITAQPLSISVAAGTVTTVFICGATNATSYQWTRNGSTISNNSTVSGTTFNIYSSSTGSLLMISNPSTSVTGGYNCVASNGIGSASSTTANLNVVSNPSGGPGRLVNLSVNSYVQGGTGPTASPLTAGFVSGGAGTSGSETLLIRGSGPALAAFGYTSDYLPDPLLTIYNQATNSSVVATDSGWGTPASNVAPVEAAIAATFAFPYANTSSLDSALVETLSSNGSGYTASVVGKSGDSGQTIMEVYDDTANYQLSTPRLVNLSCRQYVAGGKPGANLLTVGFVIGGSTAKTVLIRADGPVLGTFNISNFMPDPELQVYTQANTSSPLLVNTGWAGNPAVAQAANAVFAFAYPSTASADSAIVVTLPPGAYTAQVQSVSGVAGQVEMEVYEVP